MAKPSNSIGRIKLPGESFERPIVPYGLTDGTYYVSLPTLSEDSVVALDKDLPQVKRYI